MSQPTVFDFDFDPRDQISSCLDCAHWKVFGGCALAGDPAVEAFTDPYSGPNDPDMSNCPGFEEC